jgi:hypothetical protein
VGACDFAAEGPNEKPAHAGGFLENLKIFAALSVSDVRSVALPDGAGTAGVPVDPAPQNG